MYECLFLRTGDRVLLFLLAGNISPPVGTEVFYSMIIEDNIPLLLVVLWLM